jgi:hypothetical protein
MKVVKFRRKTVISQTLDEKQKTYQSIGSFFVIILKI